MTTFRHALIFVPAALLARVAALAPLPLIPITTHISVPETELD